MSKYLNERLKERLARRDGFLVPGAANALTARIIEDLGFEAAYVTGAGVTNMTLGMPDLGFVSLSQLADHVAFMRDATDLPLIVDADTGFGNALNTGYAIKVLERSGASAIQLEDQASPKRCGHFSGKNLISSAEMVQKIYAAVDARQDTNLQIIARTDARACLGFEKAIQRAQAYREAGADVIFLEAPQSVEELAEIPSRIDAPHLVNMVAGGLTPMLPRAELAKMGFAMVLYANAALQAAMCAMQSVLGHLRDHGSIDGVADQLAAFTERQRIVAKPHFDALDKKYAEYGEAS